MSKPLVPALLLVLLTVLPTGCFTGSHSIGAGLQAEVTGIESAADGSIMATWRLINPNIGPYLISRTSPKVYLDDVYLGMADDTDRLVVPARDVGTRTVRLTGGEAAASRALQAASAQGTGHYRLVVPIVILVYGDVTEKMELSQTGTVPVTRP